MLTRCPSCTTIFRVSTEQLKVRQGKVRCGACQSVFNALDSLIEEIAPALESVAPAPEASAPEVDSIAPAPAPIAVSPAPTYEPEVQALSASDDLTLATELTVAIDIGEPLSEASRVDAPVDESTLTAVEPMPAPPALAETADTTPHVTTPIASALETSIAAPTVIPIDTPEPEPTLLDEEAPAEARFGWLWALGIVLAIVAMLAQALMIFRVEIATSVPETRPWFVAACELLDCRVDLARKVNLLAIESSDLNPDPAFPGESGRLRLHANLHNRASHAQEWPALEVTLTDTNDRPLIRRALTAKEYLLAAKPPQSNLEQGIGGQQEISIELALDSGDVLASGYRLYLFYP